MDLSNIKVKLNIDVDTGGLQRAIDKLKEYQDTEWWTVFQIGQALHIPSWDIHSMPLELIQAVDMAHSHAEDEERKRVMTVNEAEHITAVCTQCYTNIRNWDKGICPHCGFNQYAVSVDPADSPSEEPIIGVGRGSGASYQVLPMTEVSAVETHDPHPGSPRYVTSAYVRIFNKSYVTFEDKDLPVTLDGLKRFVILDLEDEATRGMIVRRLQNGFCAASVEQTTAILRAAREIENRQTAQRYRDRNPKLADWSDEAILSLVSDIYCSGGM